MFRIRTPHKVVRVRPALATDANDNETTFNYSGGASTPNLLVNVQFNSETYEIERLGRTIEILGLLFSRTKTDWHEDDLFAFDGATYRIESAIPQYDTRGNFNHVECEFSRARDRE